MSLDLVAVHGQEHVICFINSKQAFALYGLYLSKFLSSAARLNVRIAVLNAVRKVNPFCFVGLFIPSPTLYNLYFCFIEHTFSLCFKVCKIDIFFSISHLNSSIYFMFTWLFCLISKYFSFKIIRDEKM